MCQAFERAETGGISTRKAQHPARWEDYQKFGDNKRRKYMLAARATCSDVMVMALPSLVYEPFTPSTKAHAFVAQLRFFLIYRDIVSDLMADVLFQATRDGHRNAWNVPMTFSLLEETRLDRNNRKC
ncbi:unnamed protein product [Peronospora farinosa]|uniref:Uncharacterized protein n=1 Tax=Peronospora farinosa TaxID=134698 RepID=A0AAV0T0G8_9STRA|nr:unnamed protein product [Peronospora farinosa]